MQNFTIHQRSVLILTILLLMSVLVACQPPTVSQELQPVVLPTATLEVRVDTPTETVTETVLETAVSSTTAPPPTAILPEPTSAPATNQPPTVPPATTLLPNTPWWVITDGETIWGVNANGSGLTTLFEQIGAGEAFYAHLRGAPAGGRLAFINHGATFYEDLMLTEIRLPDGNVSALTRLAPPELLPEAQASLLPAPLESIINADNLAWSPDGSKLAYMAVSGGDSSDLFVYDTAQASITRLTDGPSQGIQPLWSPNGRYILHMGVSSLGTGAGWGIEGTWAAAADNSEVITLPIPERTAEEHVLGWISDDTYLIQTADIDCGWRNLRAVSLTDQSVTLLWSGYFSRAALDLANGNVVVRLSDNAAECNTFPTVEQPSSTEPGNFLVQFDGQITPLASSPTTGVWPVRWDAAGEAFLAPIDPQLILISPTSEVQSPPVSGVGSPIVAPDGEMLAWYGYDSGLWIGSIHGTPQQTFSGQVVEAAWSPDGQTILLLASGTLYAAYAPDFVPVAVGELDSVSQLQAVWVMP